ncbi:hypothetical protein RFI_13517 [Reticulomyxa filosa]|uniref:histone deacetylase n=1 Tax=Reticulomyxa filosa TaxID=46433 RepID=X6NCP0_RETFI|nr:hypothetical protein RFI_13517 [Reticulomyxa filosa]|eukprot:ETO23663.1 hypothetical protein RFI_13517 [Reticulomyxa filosa]
MKRVGLAFHEDCLLHKGPVGHPESPQRVRKILEELKKQGLFDKCIPITGKDIPTVTKEELLLTHGENLVMKVLTSFEEIDLYSANKFFYVDSDTYYCKDTPNAALLAIGAVTELMERVFKGELDSGFAVVRPPGHHCEKSKPMGFCLFSNVVVAINAIKHKYKHTNKYQRFAVIDWLIFCLDVHHGNGSQDLFWEDENILYISLHRSDNGTFYPQSGLVHETNNGHNVNIPLWGGMGDEEYGQSFEAVICPIIEAFQPEMILISSGFDSCWGDEMGGMNVTPPMYGQFIDYLYRIPFRHPCGIVVLLEGGYHLDMLGKAACSLTYALLHGHVKKKETKKKKKKKWKLVPMIIDTTNEQAQKKKKAQFTEVLTDVLIVQSVHYPTLKLGKHFAKLNLAKNSNFIAMHAKKEKESNEMKQGTSEEVDMFCKLLSSYPYGLTIDSIASSVSYQINVLKNKALLPFRFKADEYSQDIISGLRLQIRGCDGGGGGGGGASNANSSNLWLSKCRVVGDCVLPLATVVTMYKLNNCRANKHLNGTYVLRTPLLCLHPHMRKDRLQSKVDLHECNGGFYMEYVNYHPIYPLHAHEQWIVMEGPLFETKAYSQHIEDNDNKKDDSKDDKKKENTMTKLTWQINSIADLNNEHRLVQTHVSYPFHRSDDREEYITSVLESYLQPHFMKWSVKVGDRVWLYLKDDCLDEDRYTEDIRTVLKHARTSEVVVPGRVSAIDLFRSDNGFFYVELSEGEKSLWPEKETKDPAELGIMYFKSVHLNDVAFIRGYEKTLFDRTRTIKIYLKGFDDGIAFQDTRTKQQVANVLKTVGSILEKECSARTSKDKTWNTFSLLLTFDGGEFAQSSYTFLLPIIYQFVCTHFASQITTVQLLAFLTHDCRQRFQTDWRDVVFYSDVHKRVKDNVRIWGVLKDERDQHEVGVYGMIHSRPEYVLCFGGGTALQHEFKDLLAQQNLTHILPNMFVYVFDVLQYKYVDHGRVEVQKSFFFEGGDIKHKHIHVELFQCQPSLH